MEKCVIVAYMSYEAPEDAPVPVQEVVLQVHVALKHVMTTFPGLELTILGFGKDGDISPPPELPFRSPVDPQ